MAIFGESYLLTSLKMRVSFLLLGVKTCILRVIGNSDQCLWYVAIRSHDHSVQNLHGWRVGSDGVCVQGYPCANLTNIHSSHTEPSASNLQTFCHVFCFYPFFFFFHVHFVFKLVNLEREIFGAIAEKGELMYVLFECGHECEFLIIYLILLL